jgi:hypothetical protein
VIAPVKTGPKWILAQDGQPLWDRQFVQAWKPVFNADASRLAAVVAPKYGRWTVAVDGSPWSATFADMVTDLTFSPDGSRIAALAKEGDSWRIVADGSAWSQAFDMAWQPVFSADNRYLAAKVEKNGYYTIAVNDRLWSHECDAVWDPAFSADSRNILLRSIEDGIYYRRVLPVSDLAG